MALRKQSQCLKQMRTFVFIWLLFLALFWVTPSVVSATIINGGFETGDFTGWATIGDASIQTSSFGSGPIAGIYEAVLTNDVTAYDTGSPTGYGYVYPLSGSPAVNHSVYEPFLGFPSGTLKAITYNPHFLDSPQNMDPGVGSAVKQTFYGTAGDILSFDWNALGDLGVYDYAFVSLVSSGTVFVDKLYGNYVVDNPPAGVTTGPSNTVFTYETGFQTFSYVLPAAGTYTLGFGVVQAGGAVYDSALIIDNVRVPEPATMLLLGLGLIGLAGLRKKIK